MSKPQQKQRTGKNGDDIFTKPSQGEQVKSTSKDGITSPDKKPEVTKQSKERQEEEEEKKTAPAVIETKKIECAPIGSNEVQEMPSRGRPQEHKESFSKVTVILLDRQVDWLDQLALNIRSKTKYSASRAEILRAMIDAIQESEIDLTVVKSETEIKQTISNQIKTTTT
jgi:hypothetical protein